MLTANACSIAVIVFLARRYDVVLYSAALLGFCVTCRHAWSAHFCLYMFIILGSSMYPRVNHRYLDTAFANSCEGRKNVHILS